MKNMVILLAVLSLIGGPISLWAQSDVAEDFVRNSQVAPDLINDNLILIHENNISWVLKRDSVTVQIPVLETLLLRVKDGLAVTTYSILNKEGNEQVYGVRYEANDVVRYAIQSASDKKLIVAQNLYSENDPNSIIKVFEFYYDDQIGPIAITFSLDTIEGQKTSTVELPRFIRSAPQEKAA